MKYLLLVYQEENKTHSMSGEEHAKIHAEYLAFVEDLVRKGQLIWNEGLQPVSAATTVRVRDGKISMTDGPFAETREQLGGTFLIEARDLNAAIETAARIPSARFGSIEVRPLWEAQGK